MAKPILEVKTDLKCDSCGFTLCFFKGVLIASDTRVIERFERHEKVCEGPNVNRWPADMEQDAALSSRTIQE